MNAEEPNDDYDAQAAEAARKANIKELNAVMPQLQMNAKDEGQQWPYQDWENGGNGAIVRYRGDGSEPQMADAAYLNALQQQVTELARERDMLLAVVRFAVLQPSAAHSICVSGQNDYNALTSPSTIAQEEQR